MHKKKLLTHIKIYCTDFNSVTARSNMLRKCLLINSIAVITDELFRLYI